MIGAASPGPIADRRARTHAHTHTHTHTYAWTHRYQTRQETQRQTLTHTDKRARRHTHTHTHTDTHKHTFLTAHSFRLVQNQVVQTCMNIEDHGGSVGSIARLPDTATVAAYCSRVHDRSIHMIQYDNECTLQQLPDPVSCVSGIISICTGLAHAYIIFCMHQHAHAC